MSKRAASAVLVSVRSATERSVVDVERGTVVVVACSGGPDSLALTGALAWVASRRGLEPRAIVVDHGLQEGSAVVAENAGDICARLGVPADVVRVRVGRSGGPEAAARAARYAALEAAAADLGAACVLLGHTREDQAETVLLRLARGSGARSLAAMRARSGLWRRPFLALQRSDVRAAAAELLAPLGAVAWDDPHNVDADYARVRVRALLDGLSSDLGPGVVRGLTRSADLLRDDADYLDGLAGAAYEACIDLSSGTPSADTDDLLALPAALRTRVLRLACLAAGSPADALTMEHVLRADALVTDWHGQGEVRLPGGVVVQRTCGRLCLRPA